MDKYSPDDEEVDAGTGLADVDASVMELFPVELPRACS